MDPDEPHVVHLDPPPPALQGLRIGLAVAALGTSLALAWWATNGDPAAAWESRFHGPQYFGVALIPAGILLLAPLAMVFRSISLAWIAVALLVFIGVWLLFSIGVVSLGIALVLAPAVWQYSRVEKRHRTREPVDGNRHPSQP